MHDIEDLCDFGKSQKACPYFAARHYAGKKKTPCYSSFCSKTSIMPETFELIPFFHDSIDVEKASLCSNVTTLYTSIQIKNIIGDLAC